MAICFLSGQQIGGDCEAIPTNVVRYDSPVFAGFSMSADWGQNGGYWDAYARYAGEYNGIKIAATSGWSHDNTVGCSPDSYPGSEPLSDRSASCNRACHGSVPTGDSCDVGYWQSGLYIEHVATGLFVYGAYGREFLDTFAGFNNQPDIGWSRAVCVSGGPRLVTRSSTGPMTERNDMFNAGCLGRSNVWSSRRHKHPDREWSIGVVQEIDAAAMSLWVQYDHFDASASGCAKVLTASKAVLVLLGSANGPPHPRSTACSS